MNGPQTRESRPAGYQAAPQDIHHDEDDRPSVALTADEVRRVVDGRPLVLTVTKRRDGTLRRRAHLTLATGERTQDRAVERGDACALLLVRVEAVELVLSAGEAIGRVYGERAGVARGVELGRAEAFAEVDAADEAWRTAVNQGVAARAGEPSHAELQRRRGVVA